MSMAKVVGGLLAGLVLGGGAGFVLGFGKGQSAMGDHWVASEAEQTMELTELLRGLRKTASGADLTPVESHLNRHAFGLMPATLEGLSLTPATRAQVEAATSTAKAYRREFPLPEPKTARDKDVTRFLTGG